MTKAKDFPKVSVILTSYNHAPYIAAAIDSVLNQTFTDFELLIADDGSTDDSREIIKTFDDPRIKFFLYKENRGPVLAIRDAVNSAWGKYIAVHHSDDLWAPNKLEKQIAFLDANENYAACFTWVDFIDEYGNFRELDDKDFYKKVFDQPNRSRAAWLNYFFYNANCLCHPSAVVRREAYEKYHLLDLHGFWQLPDYLMWIRLCFHAEIFILPERLTQFRLRRTRQENTSATSFDKLVRADLEFYFIVREFIYHFTDNKFFLEVFPAAEKFSVNGQINRRFAFAKLCLNEKKPAFNLAGLELLKDLLNSPVNAAEIKTLYDYDEKSFLADGGSYDIFDLTEKIKMLRSEIFVGNENFSLVAEKVIGVDLSGRFYERFDFELAEPVQYLRFDPDYDFISLKINRVLINGEVFGDFFTNAGEVINNFHRFWIQDPQIIFDVKNLDGHVTFEIFGELEKNYPAIIEKTVKDVRADNENLMAENKKLNQLVASIFDSNSWKLTAPLRDFKQWTQYDNKEKVLSVARFLYRSIPLANEKKIALKDKFYTGFAPLLKDTRQFRTWLLNKEATAAPPVQWENFFEGEFFDQPGKIAIHVHIFYQDLLQEMASFCENMPYRFDALISIVDESVATKVQTAFEKVSNAERVIVRVVPNRGRDVAPFLVGFGDLLSEYDFIAHIHSKKSLYSGTEQLNWRRYLLNALLGNSTRIRKIFKAFVEDKKVGVIYPRPAPNVPYAAFNWLSNREVGREFLNRAGISPNKTHYFDFPAGTMFWTRIDSLKKILKIGLTFEDFPPESGQNDGTLAHAFERTILLATHAENMSYYEFDPVTEAYSIDFGSKNFWQYYSRTDSEVSDGILNQGEIVSFAVFETLTMRYVAKSYHVKEIVRLKVEDLLGENFDFPTFRAKAEEISRKKKMGDPTLDEIYQSFADLTGFDADTCKKIRELEVSTEIKLSLPRERIVNWFKTAHLRGKKLWIISDTSLQTHDLERILKKCGVEGYEKLLISCETGLSKKNASIWERLIKKNLNSPYKLTHLGENERNDIQASGDRGFGEYHLMSAINLLSQVPFGKNLLEKLDYKMSLYSGIMLGVILAKKFHDPFVLNEDKGRLILKNPRETGYWFYGVPILTFILRLTKKIRIDGAEESLFLTCKGYFLQNLYELAAKFLNVDSLPSNYEKYLAEHDINFEKVGATKSEQFDEICAGIKDFFLDVLEIFSDIIMRVPIDDDFVQNWICAFERDKKILNC